ncbi:hypothetical protein BDZ97DRAFT_1762395 [Flammula alnicola]|nr:hypothetical protein BDZ97DRAFT_1762395 [Flammula alnicola]
MFSTNLMARIRLSGCIAMFQHTIARYTIFNASINDSSEITKAKIWVDIAKSNMEINATRDVVAVADAPRKEQREKGGQRGLRKPQINGKEKLQKEDRERQERLNLDVD